MNREDSFKLYFQSFMNMYSEIYSEEEITNKVNWLLDKHESLPKTEESITVRYYDFLLDIDYIESFRQKLNDKNVELGHYNKSGDIHNAFELPDISLIINNPIVLGIAANLTTELIKKVYQKIKGKKIKSIQGKNEKEKDVSFEVEVKESDNKRSQFRIKGDLSDEQIEKLIDKIPEISIKNNGREPDGVHDLSKRYQVNSNKTDWEELDLLEQMRIAREIQQKQSKE